MPRVVEVNGFRVSVYVNDHEPAHVHVVRKDGYRAKVILSTHDLIQVAGNKRHAKAARALVIAHLEECKALWRRYHE